MLYQLKELLANFCRMVILGVAVFFPPVSNPSAYGCKKLFFNTFVSLTELIADFDLNCDINSIFYMIMIAVAWVVGELIYIVINAE